MKAIQTHAILTSASTRADGSLGLRFATPELKPEEKTAFFEVQGQNMIMLLQPLPGEAPDELVHVAKEMNAKTPSQRLRAILFIEHKQRGIEGDFELYYQQEMNRIIEFRKSKLEPEQ